HWQPGRRHLALLALASADLFGGEGRLVDRSRRLCRSWLADCSNRVHCSGNRPCAARLVQRRAPTAFLLAAAGTVSACGANSVPRNAWSAPASGDPGDLAGFGRRSLHSAAVFWLVPARDSSCRNPPRANVLPSPRCRVGFCCLAAAAAL